METPQEPNLPKRGAIRESPPRPAHSNYTSVYAGF